MAEDLKHLLIETNQEFRELASKHHSLDDRLHELESKHYLSDAEQFEEVSLKKRKLQVKDRMELILRQLPYERVLARLVRVRLSIGHPVLGCPITFPKTRYDRKMFIDRAGWPFILGALLVAVAVGLLARPRVVGAVPGPRRVFPLLLPRSRSPSADGRQPRVVAGRRARDGGRRDAVARRAGGGVEGHQHVPVADGRPRQPDPGGRRRSGGWSIIRASSCRRTRRRPAS